MVDMFKRPSEKMYYLKIAESVALKSTCLRRKYGAVIVNRGEIVSTGYNGAPRGCKNCTDIGYCIRNLVDTAQGKDYNKCRSVHAEMNAMLSASRAEMLGSSIYIVGLQPLSPESDTLVYASSQPCLLCMRMLINAGIEHCYGYEYINDAEEYRVVEYNLSGERFDKRIFDDYQSSLINSEWGDPETRDAVIEHLRLSLIPQTISVGIAPYDIDNANKGSIAFTIVDRNEEMYK